MSIPPSPSNDPLAGVSREELMSALFANMVVQQTNMAMMFMGRVQHPETGEVIQDLETARTFIEQLEMLHVKTKGNLNKQEEGLLKQALGALHMAFVEAVDHPAGGPAPIEAGRSAPTTPAAPPPAEAAKPAAAAPAETPPPAPDESRKKFSKKY